ncbi:MAG: hemerythrin domain-containing protein [Elusimicrobiota bacterium]
MLNGIGAGKPLDDDKDPVPRALSDHAIASERTFFLTKLKSKIGEREGFVKLRNMETFLQKQLPEHFELEENLLFPKALELAPDLADTVRALIAEHKELFDYCGRITDETTSNVFPLPAEAVLRPNGWIDEFSAILDRHMRMEDREIYPALKKP